MSEKEEWLKIKEEFLKQSGVQKQGESLKINKKMFAMLDKGNFVLKLPKERVIVLKNEGIGIDWKAGAKVMNEWVIISADFQDKWIALTKEAKEFAFSLSKK